VQIIISVAIPNKLLGDPRVITWCPDIRINYTCVKPIISPFVKPNGGSKLSAWAINCRSIHLADTRHQKQLWGLKEGQSCVYWSHNSAYDILWHLNLTLQATATVVWQTHAPYDHGTSEELQFYTYHQQCYKKQVMASEKLCPTHPQGSVLSLFHDVYLWLAKHCFQEIGMHWWLWWWKLAVNGGGSVWKYGNSSSIPTGNLSSSQTVSTVFQF